jgi:hypothetical protein
MYMLSFVSSSDRIEYNKYLILKETSIDRFVKIENLSTCAVMPKLFYCVSCVPLLTSVKL